MEVFINDDRLGDVTFDQETLEEAVRHLQQDRCAPGQLVVGLRCDGCELSGDAMEEALRKPVARLKRVDLYTVAPGDLVRDTMARASEALDQTSDDCSRIAEMLAAGKITEGRTALAETLQVWQQVHDAVTKSIHMLGIDAEQVEVEGKSLVETISQPKEVLMQIKEALQSEDYVLLADVLQYEFDEAARRWKALTVEIGARADDYEAPSLS